MASISKTKSGKFRFEVTVNYQKTVKTFSTKAEGYVWEQNLIDGKADVKNRKIPNLTFGDLLDEYRDRVSIKKKGYRWEAIRIEKIKRDPIAQVKIADLSKRDFAEWRDRGLSKVSELSVLREWTLLNHCLTIAIEEWEYLTENPINGVKRPSKPPARDRLISDDEIERLCAALNYTPEIKLSMVTSRVGAVFMFAIETGMRAQEICNLKWDDVKGSVAKINQSKTFTGVRQVPLSSRALAIIKQCNGVDESLVFKVETSQLDSLFRQAKKKALIEGLHFHDTRHLAITRLAQKLNILELARAVGHKDLRMLQVYYNETAENLAKKLG